jgi:hypothetical protein
MLKKILQGLLAVIVIAVVGVGGFLVRGYLDHVSTADTTRSEAEALPISNGATTESKGSVTADVHSILSQFKPFELTPGINDIERLAANGQQGHILVFRHAGERGPNSYHVFMVVIGGKVAWLQEDGRVDTISDMPFDGEMVVATIRFGRSIVDGHGATILVRAERIITNGFANPTPVRIDVYELKHDPDFEYDYFDKVASSVTKNTYCNSEWALYREESVPLAGSYGGSTNSDGC